MSFSLMHDYTFLLHEDHHSVQEYIAELQTPTSDTNSDIHDTHFHYHSSLVLTQPISLQPLSKRSSFYTYKKTVLSRHDFFFLKPPTV